MDPSSLWQTTSLGTSLVATLNEMCLKKEMSATQAKRVLAAFTEAMKKEMAALALKDARPTKKSKAGRPCQEGGVPKRRRRRAPLEATMTGKVTVFRALDDVLNFNLTGVELAIGEGVRARPGDMKLAVMRPPKKKG